MPTILINGQVTEQLSVQDRGFQYGDGLFETLRVVAGEPQRWARHMARLATGCHALGMEMPEPALLLSEAGRLCDGKQNVVLKIIVTRGRGERGYAPPARPELTRVVSVTPAPTYPETHYRDGVAVRVCDTRLGRNPSLAGIKHLNRLEQVLARAEWDDTAITEGLMLDADTKNNNVIEGTMSNLFCVESRGDGPVLKTPLLDQCGVKGVTRECVMEVAGAAGILVQETALELEELYDAQELFLCNTLMGILPIRQLEERQYSVGPVTAQLSQALEALND